MTAESAAKSEKQSTGAAVAFENPLIPNAKLRQIYVAMMRARAVGKALPAARANVAVGLEACLVSPAVDLGPGDLVSDAVSGGAVAFLRGATLGSVLRPSGSAGRQGFKTNCGAAARMPAVEKAEARMWAALGAAGMLKTHDGAKGEDGASRSEGVAVVYARAGEVKERAWREALKFAATQELPVLFVVAPAARRTAQAGAMCALALRCGMPGIPVDVDDAVAIYRVAQEAIGHARIGSGPALMECVPFVVGKAGGSRDAVAVLGRYMLGRGVCTKAWIARETKAFAKRVATEKAAGKGRRTRARRRDVVRA